MMHGKLNHDIFCRVLEQIFSERDENVEVKVRLIPADEDVDDTKKDINKTA
jgi:hypothetical protein